jgi:L-threonylcarbamoyladenylate synthase
MSNRIVAPTAAAIAQATQYLHAGELVAFPTETVYGLGADAGNPQAVRRIFAAKGRPAEHPVIVHLPDESHLAQWARVVPPGARELARAFWPGPLTLILPRAAHVNDVVTGGQDSVGLRVPSHPIAQQLLQAFAAAGGSGVAGPSANRFGLVSPTTAEHVAIDLDDAVAMILDGGACMVGIESTIVAFTDREPVLLRPGAIGGAELARVLGAVPRAADANAPRASGTLASHYAPRTAARVVAAEDLARESLRPDATLAILARTVARPTGFAGMWIGAPIDAATYAHDFYANLRTLDNSGATEILVEELPNDSPWLAVRDRLLRATH